jgi:hypothetical protein
MCSGIGDHPAVSQDTLQEITRALSGLRYGSIQIIVQDSKIVQIDKTEKVRFPGEQPFCRAADKG